MVLFVMLQVSGQSECTEEQLIAGFKENWFKNFHMCLDRQICVDFRSIVLLTVSITISLNPFLTSDHGSDCVLYIF